MSSNIRINEYNEMISEEENYRISLKSWLRPTLLAMILLFVSMTIKSFIVADLESMISLVYLSSGGVFTGMVYLLNKCN